MTPKEIIEQLLQREAVCWDMALVFFDQRDHHGMHDMGVEIAALRRAIEELERVAE